jgi:hypothetical protein
MPRSRLERRRSSSTLVSIATAKSTNKVAVAVMIGTVIGEISNDITAVR